MSSGYPLLMLQNTFCGFSQTEIEKTEFISEPFHRAMYKKSTFLPLSFANFFFMPTSLLIMSWRKEIDKAKKTVQKANILIISRLMLGQCEDGIGIT